MQTADYWQLCFSDRFTGARNPARLPTLDAIPSNPLRPLSVSFYHRDWYSLSNMSPTTVRPDTEIEQRDQLTPLFHVVLLDDNDHTYDYVIEMLAAIFLL